MFTNRMLSMFVALLRLGNVLGCTPFRLDRKRGKLYVNFWSHFRVIHFSIWFAAYAVIALPTNLYYLYTIGSTRQMNFVIIVITGCIGCNLFAGIFAYRSKGVCQFLNGMLKFLDSFDKNYLQKITNKKDQLLMNMFEAFTLATPTICVLGGILGTFDLCLRPHAATYLLFNIKPEITTWWAYLIACSWYSAFEFGFCTLLGTFAYVGVMFFGFAIMLIRNEFRFGRWKYRSSKSLRENPSELFVNWRALELLMKVLNTEVMFCVLGFQAIIRIIARVPWYTSGRLGEYFSGCVCLHYQDLELLRGA